MMNIFEHPRFIYMALGSNVRNADSTRRILSSLYKQVGELVHGKSGDRFEIGNGGFDPIRPGKRSESALWD
jgi:hypothetical protein